MSSRSTDARKTKRPIRPKPLIPTLIVIMLLHNLISSERELVVKLQNQYHPCKQKTHLNCLKSKNSTDYYYSA
ncbi:hypothetical protein AL542_18510 [Grimontia hollisae]|nr:hypothetical protein AL542_18510 [Grimontia hollisae]